MFYKIKPFLLITLNWLTKISLSIIIVLLTIFFFNNSCDSSILTLNYVNGEIETKKIFSKTKLPKCKEGTDWYTKEENEYIPISEIELNKTYVLYQRYNIKTIYKDENKEFSFSLNRLSKEDVYSYATINFELDNFYFENDYSDLHIEYSSNCFYSEIVTRNEVISKPNNNVQNSESNNSSGNSDITIDDDKNQQNGNEENPFPEQQPKPEENKESVYFGKVDLSKSNLKLNFSLNKIPQHYDLSLVSGQLSYNFTGEKLKIQDLLILEKNGYQLFYIINFTVPLTGSLNVKYSNKKFDSNMDINITQPVKIKVIISKNEEIIESQIINCFFEMNFSGQVSGKNSVLDGCLENRIFFYKDSTKKEAIIEYAEYYFPKSLDGKINTDSYLNIMYNTKTRLATNVSSILEEKGFFGYYISDIFEESCYQNITATATTRFEIKSFCAEFEKK